MTATELLYACETDILESLAAMLERGSIESASWRIDRLSEMGIVNRKTIAIIKRYRSAIVANTANEIQKAAFDAAIKCELRAAEAARLGARVGDVPPHEANQRILALVERYQQHAESGMDGMLTTMAQRAGAVYADAISRASFSVIMGTESGREALVQAVHEWNDNGLSGFRDTAGRLWTTEAYANMMIRTTQRNVVTSTMFDLASEYDTDLIEVSSHAGSRPGCAPYQGNIFSRSGTDPKYPALNSTSYGEPAGLFGINCGHIAYPFWPGVSVQRNEPTQNMEQNEREYKDSQKQRGYERAIRAAKRDLKLMTALGDERGIDRAKNLVRDRQSAMRTFIDDTGRTRRYEREQIYDA